MPSVIDTELVSGNDWLAADPESACQNASASFQLAGLRFLLSEGRMGLGFLLARIRCAVEDHGGNAK